MTNVNVGRKRSLLSALKQMQATIDAAAPAITDERKRAFLPRLLPSILHLFMVGKKQPTIVAAVCFMALIEFGVPAEKAEEALDALQNAL